MNDKYTYIKNGFVLDTDRKAFILKNILFSETSGIISDILDPSEDKDIRSGEKEYNTINAEGCYIIPGLIDIHTHGAKGINMAESSKVSSDDIVSLMRSHYIRFGVTTLFPTYATLSLDELKEGGENFYKASLSPDNPVRFPGIHSEGVFISLEKKGGHDPLLLREPNIDELDYIFSGFPDGRFIVSMAPELKNGMDVIKKAADKGYIVSAAHTNATAEVIKKALDSGVKSFTHLYNAMRGLGSRETGVVGIALLSDAYTELICDGFHIAPDTVALTRKIKGDDRIILITDSVFGAGLEDGEYLEGKLKIIIKDGHSFLEDGTIAGSALDLFTAVKNYSRFTGASFAEAVVCATANPARLTGIYDITGSIERNKSADLIILDEDMNILKVFSRGKCEYIAQN